MGPVVICIADNTRARIYSQSTRGATLRLVEEIAHPEGGRKNTDLVTDRARFPVTEPRELEQKKLAHDVALHLDRARAKGELEELVIIAGPKTLGSIKAQLAPATSKRIAATIESDIAQLDEHEIAQHLRAKWFVSTPVFASQPVRALQ